jgi:uncharacterized membrane protein SpoIIM required for sporulation
MKVAQLLDQRRENWQHLERLCQQMESRRTSKLPATTVTRFAALYRAACADLALADAYQLPPNTVQYLHRLVGRAHNQLYRSRRFDFNAWGHSLFVEVPQRIFHDRWVQVAFLMFWGLFIISAVLAYSKAGWPNYAERLIGSENIEKMESDFANPLNGFSFDEDFARASFYIQHNTGIGLKCFAWGLLVVPGLYTLMWNAMVLGASFGYMARPDVPAGVNFFQFVTAHGPFELTAIVLSAGAGLRLGVAWHNPQGMARLDSMRHTARYAMPIMGAAMVMFFFAALIEGFLSPSPAPLWLKQLVAVLSTGLLTLYFLVLGFPRRG